MIQVSNSQTKVTRTTKIGWTKLVTQGSESEFDKEKERTKEKEKYIKTTY